MSNNTGPLLKEAVVAVVMAKIEQLRNVPLVQWINHSPMEIYMQIEPSFERFVN